MKSVASSDGAPSRGEPGRCRFAFVVNADTPIASWSLLSCLQAEFPDHQIDIFNLSRELKQSPVALASCVAEALFHYLPAIIAGKKTIKNAIFRTTAVERFVQKRLAAFVSPETHEFVFQMQSLWSARVPGVPHFLYTDHTNLSNASYPDPDFDAIYNSAFLAREMQTLQQATTVFTRSTNITRHVVEKYRADPHRVDCVYAGANTEDHAPPRCEEPTREDARPTILFVGMDWRRKGGPDLVRAYRDVLDKHPDARLQIVGCTPDDLPDLPGIEVLGRLPNEKLVDIYRTATVYCMPTLREPFGVAFIEALSFGLPIVATDIGAIPDFVTPGRNGYLVEPRNADQIAAALCRLLASPEKRADFGAASLALASERYNWPCVAARMGARIRARIA